MDKPSTYPPRRRHSPEVKRRVVEACLEPGASVAKVAMEHGINANLAHKWLRARGEPPPTKRAVPSTVPGTGLEPLGFVPVGIEPAVPEREIRLELRRGGETATVHWPLSAAGECAAWLRDWLG